MEKKYRKTVNYNKSDAKTKLYVKINQHKMLLNTLHELFMKENASVSSINAIKSSIDDTLKEIEVLRKEVENEREDRLNFFDSIKKKEDEVPTQVAKGVNLFNAIKKEEKKQICSVHEHCDKEQLSLEESSKAIFEKNPYDNTIFTNRFIVNLEALGIPSHMVREVNYDRNDENTLYVVLYDFMINEKMPLMKQLLFYSSVGRKFTFEIKHLDPTGVVLYKEKYSGGYIPSGEIIRGSLSYKDSDIRTILIKIKYDGVIYV